MSSASEDSDSNILTKRKKVKKHFSTQENPPDLHLASKKKKKKKRQIEQSYCGLETNDSSDKTEDTEPKIKKKKKKKSKDKDLDEKDNCSDVVETSNLDHEIGKRKSKKKRKAFNSEECDDDYEKPFLKVSKKTKKGSADEEGNSCDPIDASHCKTEVEEKRKSSKKKRKALEAEVSDKLECKNSEQNIMLNEQKHKKKKKKSKQDSFEEDIQIVNEDDTSSSGKEKKKKKKSKDKIEDNTEEILEDSENSLKRKKKKKVKENSESVKSNEDCKVNADEPVNTDENITKEKPESNIIQGQWKGDLFENEGRQNKFLRLLGGMKKTTDSNKGKGLFNSLGKGPKSKGLFGSLGSLSQSTTTANVAMSRDDANSLNKALEEDYNRALNLKLGQGRGKGLGFVPDPAEGKKFHIDTQNIKSKKFDD